ncbi:hypothetical protein [Streptomyces sp. KL116D]|uniref:hypothetical protein n=1 Tax=Streptomyces sp. KL116D TaxID=3045152 RepID=UPI003558ACC3
MAEGFPVEARTEQALMVSYTEGAERRRTGRMFTTTVKSVCAQCNSGWMCDLEGAVADPPSPWSKASW